MYNSQFASQRQNSTLASSVRKLRSRGTEESNKRSGVDDATLGLLVAAHAENSVLAAEPNTLDVNALSQIPDLLGGIDSIGVIGMHDACIVKDNVNTTPAILGLDHGLHVSLLGDIAADCLETTGVRNELLNSGEGFGEGGLGDIG